MRTRTGNISLVICAVLVIILIGVGMYLLIKVVGGGRELNNATDSGALNIAKQALVAKTTPVPLEFSQCSLPPGSPANLLVYNRMVAQALLVAMNAEAQGSGQANATQTWQDVEAIGADLRSKLANTSLTQGFFTNLSMLNSTRMNNASPVDSVTVTQGFMKHGLSTNIYFDPNEFPHGFVLPANLYSDGNIKAPNGSKYMRGYDGITIGGQTIFGVPVFPDIKPHLVSATDFLAPDSNSPDPNVPPNAFKADAKAHVNKGTDYMTGAVAAAIVGSVGQVDGTSQFPASIPGGYIELYNYPGDMTQVGTDLQAVDGIFNKELLRGIYISNDGCESSGSVVIDLAQLVDPQAGNIGTACFSTDPNIIQKWADYNNTKGSQYTTITNPPSPSNPNGSTSISYGPEDGRDQSKNPSGANQFPDPPSPDLRCGGTPGQLATRTQALAITQQAGACKYWMYPTGGPCNTNFRQFVGNYHTTEPQPPVAHDIYGLVGVEVVKGRVLNDHYAGNWASTLSSPPVSGLNQFDHNSAYPNKVPFSGYATPYQLLGMVGGCSVTPNGTLDSLWQRACEIVPGTTKAQFISLINPPTDPQNPQKGKLLMGHTMYIYQQNGQLVMNETKPPAYAGTKPDGIPPHPDGCMNTYDCLSGQVDAVHDGYVEDRPYTIGGSCVTHDKALWIPSSGAKNLLGRLEFSNETQATGTLISPN